MYTVIWKRLDQDGHDACRFLRNQDTWIIEGCAVFLRDGTPANLAYQLVCDSHWRSLHATVDGWVGAEKIDFSIERKNNAWFINKSLREDLAGLEDIDLGFTPASNKNAICRLNLSDGFNSGSMAVWLDMEDWTVKPLRQTYNRIGKNAYDYSSPLHDDRATLRVNDFGIVTEYPGLWMMISQ